MMQFIFGGLLPIIGFTVAEEMYGPIWGIVAGMIFGIGEILWEYFSVKKVSTITWATNFLILALGGLALAANDGLWFKLQPAIIEFVFGGALFFSVFKGKSLLLLLAEKQGTSVSESALSFFTGLTFRLGVFFWIHAGLATWAALAWSTPAWAMLKGVGLTVSLLLYMGAEILWQRYKVARRASTQSSLEDRAR